MYSIWRFNERNINTYQNISSQFRQITPQVNDLNETVVAVAIDVSTIVNGISIVPLLSTTRALDQIGDLLAAMQTVGELSQSTQLSDIIRDVSIIVNAPGNLIIANFVSKITRYRRFEK